MGSRIDETSAAEAATTRVVAWLEKELGAVHEIRRQPRWRPMWFATVDRGGQRLPVCVRGERTDTQLTWPLEHEMRFHEVLVQHGLRAPRVYGWIDDLPAFVMEAVPGRPDFEAVDPVASARIVDEYVQELVALHALDAAPFRAADIAHAGDVDGAATVGIRRMERIYRDQKRHANPFLEWVLGWLRRHPVDGGGRESAIVWDSGQFHHDGEHFVSLIDLEIGHLGDPMMDLAGWRMRDSVIPFGDFDEIYRRYEALSGQPVDRAAIQLHHIAFTISNELSFSHRLRDPDPVTDYTTYLQWCAETNLYATEAIAEFEGMALPDVTVPDGRPSRFAAPHQHLARSLRNISADDEFVAYQTRIAFRLARHLARANEIGDAVLEADLDDAATVLGERPASWEEGEAELERFVLSDTAGRHDEALLSLFHRRNLRAQMLNGPAGSAMTRHNPIQPFNHAPGPGR